ncbi:hypothetical protein R3P38DRAFT_2780736 [Favolaschia claudopus]|uniref:Uncharacterized protein n=1 Tax=Favolaschia claudopus TaxID=2862362 RepID=A0AAW0B6H4_9AGAR
MSLFGHGTAPVNDGRWADQFPPDPLTQVALARVKSTRTRSATEKNLKISFLRAKFKGLLPTYGSFYSSTRKGEHDETTAVVKTTAHFHRNTKSCAEASWGVWAMMSESGDDGDERGGGSVDERGRSMSHAISLKRQGTYLDLLRNAPTIPILAGDTEIQEQNPEKSTKAAQKWTMPIWGDPSTVDFEFRLEPAGEEEEERTWDMGQNYGVFRIIQLQHPSLDLVSIICLRQSLKKK